jgi:hypothetical protein
MIVKDLTELQKPEGKEAGPPIASYSQNDAGIAQAFADRIADLFKL